MYALLKTFASSSGSPPKSITVMVAGSPTRKRAVKSCSRSVTNSPSICTESQRRVAPCMWCSPAPVIAASGASPTLTNSSPASPHAAQSIADSARTTDVRE
jgi:hypothetical protein